jgi:hypothetical protein
MGFTPQQRSVCRGDDPRGQLPDLGAGRLPAQGHGPDYTGNTIYGDSAVLVEGGFEIQASLQPPAVGPTCIYLGALYSAEVKGAGGPISYSPYVLASFTEEFSSCRARRTFLLTWTRTRTL